MKNLVKNSFYAVAWTALININSVAAADAGSMFWRDKVTVGWEERALETAAQSYVSTFATFLAIIAVLFAVWWGFNILTAAWDEEKVKKWKTIIIQALMWLLIIFLAQSIINWFLGLFV